MKKSLCAVLAVILVIGVLAGCTNAGPETKQESADGSSGEIQRLTFSQNTDTQDIEPYNGTSTNSATITFQMFNALTRTDTDGKVIGDLAESFQAVDDVTWQFKLKKGVKFHNGEDFNAEAVKFSVERMINPENKFQLAPDFSILKEAVIIDENTVNIVTKNSYNGLPLRMIYLVMVPPKYIKEKGNDYFRKNPVGTGPFKFKEYVKDDHVTLTVNDQYFKGASKIKELVFKPIPEEASRIAALEAGEVDLVTGVSSSQVERLKKNQNLEVVSFPTTRAVYIGFNMLNNPVVQKRAFRQALNYAVDVDSIIKNVLDGQGKRLATVFLDHFQGYTSDVKPYPFDQAKAKELLKESGYNNEPLTLVISSALGSLKEVAETVSSQLRQVGVNVNVVQKENALLRTELAAGKIDPLFFYTFGGPYNSADLISKVAFGTKERYSTYWNKDMDDLRSKAISVIDMKESNALWKQFQEIFKDDAPAIFLYQQYGITAYSKKLKNYKPRMDELVLFDNISN
ncbi:ABC transporter substrate-binding protein [Paenibacillus hamazuiensis]|uniref:ABC transporter substrate-binding protein n=1 Tax=Paenibacillus hamazuiensis TaxID=2936508 RepID=UPI00200EEB42|nr:ABC transporter substrate-binding protein [Paenibacillus hamazuiensis]